MKRFIALFLLGSFSALSAATAGPADDDNWEKEKRALIKQVRAFNDAPMTLSWGQVDPTIPAMGIALRQCAQQHPSKITEIVCVVLRNTFKFLSVDSILAHLSVAKADLTDADHAMITARYNDAYALRMGRCYLKAEGSEDYIERALQDGLNPNCADDKGNTIVHSWRHLGTSHVQAIRLRQLKLLLAHGADINRPNYYGKTPADCTHGCAITYKALIECGAAKPAIEPQFKYTREVTQKAIDEHRANGF